MSPKAHRPVQVVRPGPKGVSGRVSRAMATLFWTLADSIWTMVAGMQHAFAGARLWLGGLLPGLVRKLRSLPDDTADFAIRLGLGIFAIRWPLVTLASLAGATAIAGQWPSTTTFPDLGPALTIRKTSTHSFPPASAAARHYEMPRPGPAALQAELESLTRDFGETVGVSIVDTSANWIVGVNGDRPFPQQSVSKLWVALTTLEAIDRGVSSLDQTVILTEADRSVFNQPISYQIKPEGFSTTVGDLLKRALIGSDNAANDKLMGLAGGPAAVRLLLREKGLEGISLAEDERHLQAHIAGLTWSPDLAPYGAFNTARSRLPQDVRQAALDAYIDHPYDGARPNAIALALAQLKAGKLLSETSTNWMLDVMAKATTGPSRLKGGLPAGWHIAHKTGTGQDFRGASVGINDVGLITAPDGRTYAVAVLLPKTRRPVSERLAFMQAVTRAIVAQWEPIPDPAGQSGSNEPRSAD